MKSLSYFIFVFCVENGMKVFTFMSYHILNLHIFAFAEVELISAMKDIAEIVKSKEYEC
jgi:hypothetical protein